MKNRKEILDELSQHWDSYIEINPSYFNNVDLAMVYKNIIEICNSNNNYKVIRCTHINRVVECSLLIDGEIVNCPSLFI